MANLVVIKRQKSVKLLGEQQLLRRIVFDIGDVVWPGWDEDVRGRDIYRGYGDTCSDGELTCHRHGFFDAAWPSIEKRLQMEGVSMSISTEPNVEGVA